MEMEWQKKLSEIFRKCFCLKYLLPVSLGFLIAAVVVRIVQLNVAVDFTTGFYSKKTLWVPLLTAIILIYLAYTAVHAFYHKIRPKNPYQIKNTIPATVITGAAGIMLMLEGFISIFSYAFRSSELDVLNLIAVVLEIASGAALIYHASLFYRRLDRLLLNHILLAVPAVWSLFSLISGFVRHTTIASVSEYVFDILFHAVLVLFLLYYARFTAGILEERQKYRLVISGFWLIILGAVSALPVLFCKIFEPSRIGQYISAPGFNTIAMTAFAGMLVFLIVKEAAFKPKEPEDQLSSRMGCEYRYETVQPHFDLLQRRYMRAHG